MTANQYNQLIIEGRRGVGPRTISWDLGNSSLLSGPQGSHLLHGEDHWCSHLEGRFWVPSDTQWNPFGYLSQYPFGKWKLCVSKKLSLLGTFPLGMLSCLSGSTILTQTHSRVPNWDEDRLFDLSLILEKERKCKGHWVGKWAWEMADDPMTTKHRH